MTLLAAGKFLNSAGDWIFTITCLSLILSITHNSWILALYLLSKMLPSLLFSSYGGVLADKFNRRAIIITANLIQTAAALLPLFAQSYTLIIVLIVSSLCITSADAIFLPAEKGLITELFSENLGQANSLLASGTALSMILGSAIGGIASGTHTYIAIIINSITFFINACIIIFINWKYPSTKSSSSTKPPLPQFNISYILREMRDGWLIIRKYSLLIHLFLLLIGVSLAAGGVNILLSVVASHNLKLGATGIGFAYAGLGVGSFLGSLLAAKLPNSGSRLAALVGWTTIIEGLFIGFYSLFSIPWLAILMLTIAGFFSTLNDVSIETTVMAETPESVLGRFYGFIEMGTTIAFAFSTFLIGLAILNIPLYLIAILISLLWIVTGLLWFIMRRNQRTLPSLHE